MILPFPCHVNTLNVAQLCGILLTATKHQENVNPIEKVERSTLIMASTVHQQPTAALIKESSAPRLFQASPQLFLKDVAAADWFLGGQFTWYHSTGSNSLSYFFLNIMFERYLFLCDTFGPHGLFWMVFMLISWPLGLCNQSPWHLVSTETLVQATGRCC